MVENYDLCAMISMRPKRLMIRVRNRGYLKCGRTHGEMEFNICTLLSSMISDSCLKLMWVGKRLELPYYLGDEIVMGCEAFLFRVINDNTDDFV